MSPLGGSPWVTPKLWHFFQVKLCILLEIICRGAILPTGKPPQQATQQKTKKIHQIKSNQIKPIDQTYHIHIYTSTNKSTKHLTSRPCWPKWIASPVKCSSLNHCSCVLRSKLPLFSYGSSSSLVYRFIKGGMNICKYLQSKSSDPGKCNMWGCVCGHGRWRK